MQKPVNEWGSGCATGEESDREKEETSSDVNGNDNSEEEKYE